MCTMLVHCTHAVETCNSLKCWLCGLSPQDPDRDCGPVDCAVKYRGARNFYRNTTGRCEQVAPCNTRGEDGVSIVAVSSNTVGFCFSTISIYIIHISNSSPVPLLILSYTSPAPLLHLSCTSPVPLLYLSYTSLIPLLYLSCTSPPAYSTMIGRLTSVIVLTGWRTMRSIRLRVTLKYRQPSIPPKPSILLVLSPPN